MVNKIRVLSENFWVLDLYDMGAPPFEQNGVECGSVG